MMFIITLTTLRATTKDRIRTRVSRYRGATFSTCPRACSSKASLNSKNKLSVRDASDRLVKFWVIGWVIGWVIVDDRMGYY